MWVNWKLRGSPLGNQQKKQLKFGKRISLLTLMFIFTFSNYSVAAQGLLDEFASPTYFEENAPLSKNEQNLISSLYNKEINYIYDQRLNNSRRRTIGKIIVTRSHDVFYFQFLGGSQGDGGLQMKLNQVVDFLESPERAPNNYLPNISPREYIGQAQIHGNTLLIRTYYTGLAQSQRVQVAELLVLRLTPGATDCSVVGYRSIVTTGATGSNRNTNSGYSLCKIEEEINPVTGE